MPFLTERQLKRICEHKYKRPNELSYLECVFDGFWDWTVKQIPLCWAPNCITLAGLIINTLTSITIFYHNFDGSRSVPTWAYLVAAVGLFLYQVLDSIDGKQARRTNSCSPVGELLDHGCDSITTVFLALAFSLTVQASGSPDLLFFITFSAMFLFYLAHWQAYVTGVLRTGKMDVIELQWCVIVAYLLTAAFGESLWLQQVPGMPVIIPRNVLLASMLVFAAFYVFENFSIIFIQGGIGRNGSTVAGTSVLFPIFPIAAVIVAALVIAKKSSVVYGHNCCLYILMFGMVFVKVTLNVIVAHMTMSRLYFVDSIYLGPGMLFMNQYFNFLLDEYYVLWCAMVYCVLSLVLHCILLMQQISVYLGICFFSITPRCPIKRSS